jgi:ribulose-phosphate 3-epimerase
MDADSLLAELHSAVPLIAPSLLACDLANIEREVHAVEEAGARILHLDVMDGHFVPNLSFGVPVVEAIRRVTHLPLDVHLMISEPSRYVGPFRDAGADLLTFHVEAVPDPIPLLRRIRGLGALAGIAINPPTPVSALERCLPCCDLVLVMSVMPGFGGQKFEPEVLEKFGWLGSQTSKVSKTSDVSAVLSVDGGVNEETIAPCAAAGAHMFVTGTGLFSYPDYHARLAELEALARSASDVRV